MQLTSTHRNFKTEGWIPGVIADRDTFIREVCLGRECPFFQSGLITATGHYIQCTGPALIEPNSDIAMLNVVTIEGTTDPDQTMKLPCGPTVKLDK